MPFIMIRKTNRKATKMSKTFIMLKPDSIERNLVYTVFEYIKKQDLTVECMDITTATADKLDEHYAEVFARFDEDFRKKMQEYFVDKAVVPMVLSGENAVDTVRKLIGATNPAAAEKGTVRGDLSDDSYDKAGAENRALHNLIHASDSDENAKREAKIWLPQYEF